MNLYVTGNTIKQLREQKKMTQAELADKIDVSSKTVSKWENAKGLPDISLLEPLSAALGVSVMELMKGDAVINQNRSANLLRSKLYVCPICGNVIHTRDTKPEIHVEVCSKCHPFYTGKQKLVDTGGRVERFKRRFAKSGK